MKKPAFLRTFLVAMFAASAALPAMTTSAAIPCGELPLIEADPMMPVPMIYIELPVSVQAALVRGGEADRANTTEPEEDVASGVTMAAENQFRCLGYGMDTAFVGNSTPQQRVNMFARPNIEAEVEQYIEVDSLYLVELGDPIALEDGRFLIDFSAIVDGDQYLYGELVFAATDGEYYLDGSAVNIEPATLSDPIVVELSTTFTREVKMISAINGDQIVFQNTEEEESASIVIANADGETVFEGHAGGTTLVGGEDKNIFVVYDLEPGEYQVAVTFSPSEVVYGATLIVGADDGATPVASPESTPAN